MANFLLGERDWDDERYLKWRELVHENKDSLNELIKDFRRDDHEEPCWDQINDMAQFITELERDMK
jgi:hypothetical protein